jgi:hypothetical protein
MTDNTAPRWKLLSTCGKPMILPPERLQFIAAIGEYDVLYDQTSWCYTVVKEPPAGGSRKHNFTDYQVRGELIAPEDGDVPLDPYHMCLLYQLHAEVGHTLRFEEEDDA